MMTAVLVGWASAVVAQADKGNSEVWGTVPAWVSAIGASLAFFLTFTLFLMGRKERVRQQADMIYATEEVVEADGDERGLVATAKVYNKSTAPIWDVEIHPRWSSESDIARGPDRQPRPFVEPETPVSCWTWKIEEHDLINRRRPPRVVFSDAAGRRWEKVGSRATRQTWLRRQTRGAKRRWLARRER